MRKQRSGHIVMVASIAGRCAQPVIGAYAASKWALEGWSEALRIEMQPVGVQIAIVEPGAYETDIWERNAQLGKSVNDPSSPNAARGKRFSEHIQKSVHKADAREVAQLILRIAENPRPKLRYVAGKDAKMQLAFKTLAPWKRYEKAVAKFLKIDRLD